MNACLSTEILACRNEIRTPAPREPLEVGAACGVEIGVKIRIAATPRSALDATLHAACYRPVSIATLAEAYLHPMASECFWWLKL
jgi:hypothetical protein